MVQYAAMDSALKFTSLDARKVKDLLISRSFTMMPDPADKVIFITKNSILYVKSLRYSA